MCASILQFCISLFVLMNFLNTDASALERGALVSYYGQLARVSRILTATTNTIPNTILSVIPTVMQRNEVEIKFVNTGAYKKVPASELRELDKCFKFDDPSQQLLQEESKSASESKSESMISQDKINRIPLDLGRIIQNFLNFESLANFKQSCNLGWRTSEHASKKQKREASKALSNIANEFRKIPHHWLHDDTPHLPKDVDTATLVLAAAYHDRWSLVSEILKTVQHRKPGAVEQILKVDGPNGSLIKRTLVGFASGNKKGGWSVLDWISQNHPKALEADLDSVIDAANKGNTSMCRYLLDRKKLELLKRSDFKYPAYHCAVEGDPEMLNFVIQNDPSALLGIEQQVSDRTMYFRAKNTFYTTLAGSAASRGDLPTLGRVYNANHQSLQARNSQFQTPMHEAAAAGSLSGVAFIFEKNKNAFRDQDWAGYTPAFKTIKENYSEESTLEKRHQVLEFIGQQDPESLLILDDREVGPIHYAVANGDLKAIDIISNAVPHALIQESPALWAARSRNMDALELILTKMKKKRTILNSKNVKDYFKFIFDLQDIKTILDEIENWILYEANNGTGSIFNITPNEMAAIEAKKKEIKTQCIRIKQLFLDLDVDIGNKLNIDGCRE